MKKMKKTTETIVIAETTFKKESFNFQG